ncbi:hypothetical protein D3C71_2236780 [compost metagenome]
MPYSPMNAAMKIITKRSIRTDSAILKAGITKLEIPVSETTMTMAGETIPASTAA